MKSVALHNLGCKVNAYEIDVMQQMLQENGYKIAGLFRECYIDGIWNKESVEDWLTEVQLPIE